MTLFLTLTNTKREAKQEGFRATQSHIKVVQKIYFESYQIMNTHLIC